MSRQGRFWNCDTDMDAYDGCCFSYRLGDQLGCGAYGIVLAAANKVTKEEVAIKRVPLDFSHFVKSKRLLREIKLLHYFDHENIISLKNLFVIPSKQGSRNILLVLDLMDTDLHLIIKSKQHLETDHIRYFMYQIFRGLKFIHSAGVIHRDLKPSNILVNEDCRLKIADFGMARSVLMPETKKEGGDRSYAAGVLSQYVATRYYRAPELLLSVLNYDSAIDMWSAGCIFAELITFSVFLPGKSELHQLQLIVDLLGSPREATLQSLSSDVVRNFVRSFGVKRARLFAEVLPGAPRKAIDIISKLLVYEGSARATAAELLEHRFFDQYHDPADEPVCPTQFDFSFERTANDLARVRQEIQGELDWFRERNRDWLLAHGGGEDRDGRHVAQNASAYVERAPTDVNRMDDRPDCDKMKARSAEAELLCPNISRAEPSAASFSPLNTPNVARDSSVGMEVNDIETESISPTDDTHPMLPVNSSMYQIDASMDSSPSHVHQSESQDTAFDTRAQTHQLSSNLTFQPTVYEDARLHSHLDSQRRVELDVNNNEVPSSINRHQSLSTGVEHCSTTLQPSSQWQHQILSSSLSAPFSTISQPVDSLPSISHYVQQLNKLEQGETPSFCPQNAIYEPNPEFSQPAEPRTVAASASARSQCGYAALASSAYRLFPAQVQLPLPFDHQASNAWSNGPQSLEISFEESAVLSGLTITANANAHDRPDSTPTNTFPIESSSLSHTRAHAQPRQRGATHSTATSGVDGSPMSPVTRLPPELQRNVGYAITRKQNDNYEPVAKSTLNALKAKLASN